MRYVNVVRALGQALMCLGISIQKYLAVEIAKCSNIHSFMESLILAQDERWRRGLGMQVERVNEVFGLKPSGERVSNT